MTLPLELFANSPSPGGAGPWVLTTLAEAITTLPTSGTLEDWAVSDSAPSELTTSAPQGGQFRVVIDDEIMIVVASASGDSPWQFKRGEEGTNPALHAAGTPIYHIVTARSLTTAVQTGGLQADNNLADVPSPVDARTNLGLGSAATQPSSAFETAGTASAAVTTERTRAIAAESALAPVASPTFTGSPTAPTRAALDSSTNIATTAYSDAAVGVEATRAQAVEATNASAIATEVARAQAAEATHATTAALATEATRAQAAEALAVQKSSNLSDLPSVSVARANLGLGSAATQSSSAFDAAGAAAAAAAASEPVGTAATAVAVEQTRATTAEAALAPLASPTFTGNPTAPTRTALDNSTKVATTAYTDAATAVERARALGVEASLAPIANPTFTGAVGVPTRTAGDSTTNAASTAFVAAAVSAVSAGLITKPSVQWATAAALPANTYSAGVLTATSNGILTVDDNPPALGDRILVKNEATAANNGTYVLTQLGDSTHPYILTRGADMNTGSQVPGAYVFVQYGAGNIGSGWTVSGAGPFTLGTTAITWVQFSSGVVNAGTGLAKSGSTISIASSASLPGSPTATTQAALDNSTKLATTAYSDAAVSVEATARANADAALAPLASPALTGNPTVPTQAALTNNTRAASTAYADAATAVEKSRAQIAEGLAAQKSNNLSDLPSPSTARTNLGLGTASLLASGAVAQVANNLSDLASAAAALANLGGAPLASPALTGTPTVPTQTALDASTKIASTAYTDSAVGVERSRALGIEAGLAPLASPALTGNPTVPTQAALNNSTRAASTAYADAAVGVEATRATTAEALKAPLASPALTGIPTAPTPAALDNSTKLATTAYADGSVATEAAARVAAVTAEITARTSADTAETARATAQEALAVKPTTVGTDPFGRTQVQGSAAVPAPALRQMVYADDAPFNAAGDAGRSTDAAMQAGSPTLTTSATLKVGQAVQVIGAGASASGALGADVVTTGPTTSLSIATPGGVSGLPALVAGQIITTSDGANALDWTVGATGAAANAASISVVSQTSTHAYPTGAAVTIKANLHGYVASVGAGTASLVAMDDVTPLNASTTVNNATVTYGTHDGAAVVSAGTAIGAAGSGTLGGILRFMPGKAYLVGRVVPASGVTYTNATFYNFSQDSNGSHTNQPCFYYSPALSVGGAGVNHVSFVNLKFPGHGSETSSSEAIFMGQATDVRIYDCEVTNNAAGAFYIKDCSRVKVRGNRVDSCSTTTGINPVNFVSGAYGDVTPLTDILVTENTVTNCGAEGIAFVTTGSNTISTAPLYLRIDDNFIGGGVCAAGIWIETGGTGLVPNPQQRVLVINNEVAVRTDVSASGIFITNDSVPGSASSTINENMIVSGNDVTAYNGISVIGSYILVEGNVVNATNRGLYAAQPSGTTSVTGSATVGSNQITGVTGGGSIVRGQQMSGTGVVAGTYLNAGMGTATWTMSAVLSTAGSTGAITLTVTTPAYGVKIASNTVHMAANFAGQGIHLFGLQKSSASNNTISCDLGSTAGGPGIYVTACGWLKLRKNDVDHAPTHGIQVVNSNDVKIKHNDVRNSSEAGAGSCGIYLQNVTGTSNPVIGNEIIDDRPTPLALYSLYLITLGTGAVNQNVRVREGAMLGHTSPNPMNTFTGVSDFRPPNNDTPNWLTPAALGSGSYPALPASASNWTNTLPYAVQLLITGGAGVSSKVSRNGGTTLYGIGITVGVTPVLEPGDIWQPTYTTAPTVNAWPVWA